MRGDISKAKKANRHPLDWYVEEGWEWDQVIAEIGLDIEREDDCHIWDPCAGFGHAGSRIEPYGFEGRVILSDLVENVAYDDFAVRPRFFAADFLEQSEAPAERLSIWFNPPYSYKPGILEACVRQAMRLATHRVVALVPLKWTAAGKKRSRLFRHDHAPELQLIFTERPSMPPGDMIDAMGKRAYRGGVIDYACFVWDVRHPTAHGETRTIWLPPLAEVGGAR